MIKNNWVLWEAGQRDEWFSEMFLHLFLFFYGKILSPVPQRMGFHGKTKKGIEHPHQITHLFSPTSQK